jgi:hypothetical protein
MKNKIIIGDVNSLGVSSELVCQYYKDNWPRSISLGIFSFYEWQFRRPPENIGVDNCCVAIDASGKILGVIGLNRRSFYLAGKQRNAAELTTWIVSESARGRGIGGKILHYLKEKYDVLLGMGVTEAALPLYLKSDFRFIRYIPRFVRVFDLAEISKISEPVNLSRRLIAKWSNSYVLKYDVRETLPSELSVLGKYLPTQFNYFNRDRDSLLWRYDEHPIYDYKSFIIKAKGKGVGIVLRIEKFDSFKIMHVIDIFGDLVDTNEALNFIDKYCIDMNVSISDFYCTSSKITRHFVSAGWFSTVDDYYFEFPHLFHPIELRKPATTSLIYWAKTGMEDLADISSLYLTKGDIDLDRPTGAYYDKKKVVSN